MKNSVILVHGFNDNASKMKHIQNALYTSGWTVFSVSLKPSSGQIGIDELAQQLKSYINDNVGLNQHIDLIGFSMGGLVSRYYLQRLDGLDRVNHFISISTPHNGTLLAYLLWNKGGRQMRYKSAFVTKLNRDVCKLKSLQVTSIWTPFDLMILPASSSQLSFGHEIKIKSLWHPLMVSSKRCIEVIEKQLIC